MLAIKSKFNLSLMTGKIVSESSGLVIGLLLGGPIGLGSLIIVFAITFGICSLIVLGGGF